MIKKALTFVVAALMVFLTIISAVNAETLYNNWNSDYSGHYNYYYYNNDYGNYDDVKIPVVAGPFQRYALVYESSGGFFHPDDFNHYDEFIGYKDLDVFYADGRIDVLRNPSATELDTSDVHVPEDMQRFGYHISGILPDGAIYRKHYMHDHELGLDYYDCGYDYDYFTPFSNYNTRPVYTSSCQSRNLC